MAVIFLFLFASLSIALFIYAIKNNNEQYQEWKTQTENVLKENDSTFIILEAKFHQQGIIYQCQGKNTKQVRGFLSKDILSEGQVCTIALNEELKGYVHMQPIQENTNDQ